MTDLSTFYGWFLKIVLILILIGFCYLLRHTKNSTVVKIILKPLIYILLLTTVVVFILI